MHRGKKGFWRNEEKNCHKYHKPERWRSGQDRGQLRKDFYQDLVLALVFVSCVVHLVFSSCCPVDKTSLCWGKWCMDQPDFYVILHCPVYQLLMK